MHQADNYGSTPATATLAHGLMPSSLLACITSRPHRCYGVCAHGELAGLLLMQTKAIVEHVMDDVQAMAPPTCPNLEKLRMAYPSIGCWAPTCVLLRCSLIVSEFIHHRASSC